jgi:hypothetical protein
MLMILEIYIKRVSKIKGFYRLQRQRETSSAFLSR